jgi:hypothetical protein
MNIRLSTSLARRATPADENGWPTGIDTLLLRRVGTGCEPVIRIVKEPWRLSPVAFRCLSTASVLRLEEHFRGKDQPAGALRSDGRCNPIGKYHTARRQRCGCDGHRCRQIELTVVNSAGCESVKVFCNRCDWRWAAPHIAALQFSTERLSGRFS